MTARQSGEAHLFSRKKSSSARSIVSLTGLRSSSSLSSPNGLLTTTGARGLALSSRSVVVPLPFFLALRILRRPNVLGPPSSLPSSDLSGGRLGLASASLGSSARSVTESFLLPPDSTSVPFALPRHRFARLLTPLRRPSDCEWRCWTCAGELDPMSGDGGSDSCSREALRGRGRERASCSCALLRLAKFERGVEIGRAHV